MKFLEDNLKNEDDIKIKDKNKNEDDPKNEDDFKIEDDIKKLRHKEHGLNNIMGIGATLPNHIPACMSEFYSKYLDLIFFHSHFWTQNISEQNFFPPILFV